MASGTTHLPLAPGPAFATLRRDAWWLPQILTFAVFSTFIVYSTWAALQNAHYTFGNYLSPFYSPELWGNSPHAWFGKKPTWFPDFLPYSPALMILWAPAGFRVTCYYYRGAYYKAFWADPPGCTVTEPRKSYLGERSFPLIIQNIHRYFLYLALMFLPILTYDAYMGLWVIFPPYRRRFAETTPAISTGSSRKVISPRTSSKSAPKPAAAFFRATAARFPLTKPPTNGPPGSLLFPRKRKGEAVIVSLTNSS